MIAFGLGFVLLAVSLDELRSAAAVSSSTASTLEAAAAASVVRRDEAEAALESAKRAIDEGKGGVLAERRVRSRSAQVRRLMEATDDARSAARQARAAAARDRERLRDALFSEASQRTALGDASARGGNRGEALARYREAATLLDDAARLPVADGPEDPWAGIDAVVPVTGLETDAERAAHARAYRDTADRVAAILSELAPSVEASEAAVAAWESLSRYRGVLDRFGEAPPDPTPRRDRLREIVKRGTALEQTLRERADEITPRRMGVKP